MTNLQPITIQVADIEDAEAFPEFALARLRSLTIAQHIDHARREQSNVG